MCTLLSNTLWPMELSQDTSLKEIRNATFRAVFLGQCLCRKCMNFNSYHVSDYIDAVHIKTDSQWGTLTVGCILHSVGSTITVSVRGFNCTSLLQRSSFSLNRRNSTRNIDNTSSNTLSNHYLQHKALGSISLKVWSYSISQQ